jgi:hypothetical protein
MTMSLKGISPNSVAGHPTGGDQQVSQPKQPRNNLKDKESITSITLSTSNDENTKDEESAKEVEQKPLDGDSLLKNEQGQPKPSNPVGLERKHNLQKSWKDSLSKLIHKKISMLEKLELKLELGKLRKFLNSKLDLEPKKSEITAAHNSQPPDGLRNRELDNSIPDMNFVRTKESVLLNSEDSVENFGGRELQNKVLFPISNDHLGKLKKNSLNEVSNTQNPNNYVFLDKIDVSKGLPIIKVGILNDKLKERKYKKKLFMILIIAFGGALVVCIILIIIMIFCLSSTSLKVQEKSQASLLE